MMGGKICLDRHGVHAIKHGASKNRPILQQ